MIFQITIDFTQNREKHARAFTDTFFNNYIHLFAMIQITLVYDSWKKTPNNNNNNNNNKSKTKHRSLLNYSSLIISWYHILLSKPIECLSKVTGICPILSSGRLCSNIILNNALPMSQLHLLIIVKKCYNALLNRLLNCYCYGASHIWSSFLDSSCSCKSNGFLCREKTDIARES